MSTLLDLSEKSVDPGLVELLCGLTTIALEHDAPFFIVGATARDLILNHGFGIRTWRATADVDIAVRVASWTHYERLRDALIRSGEYERVGDKQRLKYRGNSLLDLLPFGKIGEPGARIAWPPHGDTEMNLVGFEEAFQHSIEVRLRSQPELIVRVASSTGLVMLKIFAWEDRKPENRDAIDLGVLIAKYVQAGNTKRLVEEHPDLLDDEPFDFQIAGARMLGRDLAHICQADTRQQVLRILNRELDEGGELPLVVRSAGESPQVPRSLAFWTAIRDEMAR